MDAPIRTARLALLPVVAEDAAELAAVFADERAVGTLQSARRPSVLFRLMGEPPPREAMVNEQEVRELFFEQLQHLSPEAEYELRHPDYVMEMPQSGERIRGRERMRAFQEAYPNPPSIQPRRVVGAGDVWVVEARSDYGDGQIFNVAMIVEFRDGRIWRDTRYYAQPFEPPEWRAQWVEPMEDPPREPST